MTMNEIMKGLKFGIEVELFGKSRQHASEIIAKHFGTSNYYIGQGCYDVWGCNDNKARKWQVMRDGSVNTNGGEACEVVSPLLGYDDIEDLQEIIRALRKAGYKADYSCGIHVHVDNTGMNISQIKNLVNFVSSHEELIYQALKIREMNRERWCQKTDERFKAAMNESAAHNELTFDSLEGIWYRTQGHGDRYSHYDSSRYHLLNLHSMWQGKGIEFRCFNGTTHAGEIKAYIQFCLALVAKAYVVKTVRLHESASINSHRTMERMLRHMGLRGDEFKTCRLHMMKNLTAAQSVAA